MTLLVGAPPGLSACSTSPSGAGACVALFLAIPNARALEVSPRTRRSSSARGMGTGRACCALAASTYSPMMRAAGRSSKNEYHGRARPGRRSTAVFVAAARRHGRPHARALLPPYDDDGGAMTCCALTCDTFIYIGEPDEGATGSVPLSARAEAQLDAGQAVDLPRWPRLRDTLMIYRRNVERRPISSAITASSASASFLPARSPLRLVLRAPALALALQVGSTASSTCRDARRMPPAQRSAVERSPDRIR